MKELLLATLVAIGTGGEQSERPVALPSQVPPPSELRFTGPDEGWPPAVKGATDVRLVAWKEISGAMLERNVAGLRAAALHSPRVRELLGERFAFVSSAPVETKEPTAAAGGSPDVRLVFYSYTHNTAVDVRMHGTEMQSALQRKDEAPPEGQEEVAVAIALAERDPRLAGKLQGLNGNALIAFPANDQLGFGHRVLDVTFTKEGVDLALYFALVDLTDQVVLVAGPTSERGRRQP